MYVKGPKTYPSHYSNIKRSRKLLSLDEDKNFTEPRSDIDMYLHSVYLHTSDFEYIEFYMLVCSVFKKRRPYN